ncbi:MAG: hypothetical protein DI585_06660 [Pseudomonas fluorescens]|nr:MAG: hypothetical protein DI585_06660 [Pseudomonas fluorescens]
MTYPLTSVNAKATVGMIMREHAEPVAWSDRYLFRGEQEPYRLPSVIRMNHNVDFLHNVLTGKPVRYSPINLAIRDEYICHYSGREVMWAHDDPLYRATMDHVYPSGQEGENWTWWNALLASEERNNKKGNRTPRQADMWPLVAPWEPSAPDMLFLHAERWRGLGHIPEEWLFFLEKVKPTAKVERVRELRARALEELRGESTTYLAA